MLSDNVVYSGHENGQVISWKNIEEDLHYHVLYKHHRRVTSIAGLDMGEFSCSTSFWYPGVILVISS